MTPTNLRIVGEVGYSVRRFERHGGTNNLCFPVPCSHTPKLSFFLIQFCFPYTTPPTLPAISNVTENPILQTEAANVLWAEHCTVLAVAMNLFSPFTRWRWCGSVINPGPRQNRNHLSSSHRLNAFRLRDGRQQPIKDHCTY